jgi:hypothetical protein
MLAALLRLASHVQAFRHDKLLVLRLPPGVGASDARCLRWGKTATRD